MRLRCAAKDFSLCFRRNAFHSGLVDSGTDKARSARAQMSALLLQTALCTVSWVPLATTEQTVRWSSTDVKSRSLSSTMSTDAFKARTCASDVTRDEKMPRRRKQHEKKTTAARRTDRGKDGHAEEGPVEKWGYGEGIFMHHCAVTKEPHLGANVSTLGREKKGTRMCATTGCQRRSCPGRRKPCAPSSRRALRQGSAARTRCPNKR